jgi:hypothetical protein
LDLIAGIADSTKCYMSEIAVLSFSIVTTAYRILQYYGSEKFGYSKNELKFPRLSLAVVDITTYEATFEILNKQAYELFSA